MNNPSEKKVYEPEVLPPENGGPFSGSSPNRTRTLGAVGTILAGVLIDLLDFITFGPHGLRTGLIAGGLVGLWAGSILKLPLSRCLIWALGVGLYCTLPFTERLPLATLAGVYLYLRQVKRKKLH